MSQDLAKCLSELEDLHDETRARAIAGLGKLGDPVAFLALDKVANADSSIQLRFAAKRVLHQLQESLEAQAPRLTISSDALALGRQLGDADPSIRKKCLELCLAARQMAVMPLVPSMLETEQDIGVRRSGLLAATLAGRHAIRVLSPFVGDADAGVREAAIICLGIIDDVDVFPHAVWALTDPASAVQRHGLRICSRLGKANFQRLLERMASSTKPWKRLAVVRACGRIRQATLRPIVERLWEDPDNEVRQAAAAALAAIGDAPAPPAPPPQPAARAPAGQAAPARKAPQRQPPGPVAPKAEPPPRAVTPAPGDSMMVPAALVSDAAVGTRQEELSAWVRQTDTARVPEIQDWFAAEKDPRMRASLVAAAGKLGGRLAVEMLKKCLSDPDGRIRANAVEGLHGKVRPEALVGLLNDTDNRCRANAIVALKDHKRVDLAKHLKEMANGEPGARKSAIYAIVELGTPAAAAILDRFDDDPDADVKEKAKQAREMLAARLAEAEAAAAQPPPGAAGQAGPGAAGDAGGSKLDQLKAKIADAFGAFRRKLGRD